MDLRKLIANYPEVRIKIEEEDKTDFLKLLIDLDFLTVSEIGDVILYPDGSLLFTGFSENKDLCNEDIPTFSSSVILSKKNEWE